MKAMMGLAAFAAVFLYVPGSMAAELVVNGGFETGDFSGWQQVGDESYTGVYDTSSGLPVADGMFSAAFGPSGYGGITQTIDTVPGKNYDVSFEIANIDTSYNNQLIFSFDDGFQIITDPLAAFGFSTVTLPVTASGLTADVSFLFYNPDGYFLLDNVSVTPAAVPEPATWGLMLAGFAAIGGAMRRRRLSWA